jgi:hypothetical protein
MAENPEHKKEFDEFVAGTARELSPGTLKQYKSQFNIIKIAFPDTQLRDVPNSELLEYINTAKAKGGKELTINTKKNLLNLLVMIKKQVSHDEYKELFEAREAFRGDVDTEMKKKHEAMDLSKMPTYEKLKNYLNKQSKHSYIINYLLFNYAVRNKDLNVTIAKYDRDTGIPDEGNWLLIGGEPTITYVRNDYKTVKTHGQLVYDINNVKFYNAVTDLFDREEYKLLRTKQVDQEIRSYTLNGIGETDLTKILVHHYLMKNSYSNIFELSQRRGTSVDTLLQNYNWKYVEIKEED